MEFRDLYELVKEHHDVVEEGLKNKLKVAALAAFLGVQVASLPEINKSIKKYTSKASKAEIQQVMQMIDHEASNPTPELLRAANALPDTEENESAEPATASTPNQQKNASDFLRKAAKFLSANEGVHTKAYKDVYGLLTIGIGHLVKPNDVKNGALLPEEVTLDKRGNIIDVKLTPKRVYQLFVRDVNWKLESVRKHFSSYDDYPEPLKIAILDGFFRGDISGSPRTMALIRKAVEFCQTSDLERARAMGAMASKEFLDNAEYKSSKENETGVHRRMQRVASFIKYAFDEGHPFDYTSSVY